MAKIGLIDVDGHNYPNLALMKLSAHHKANGDIVEWYNGIDHYDKVYQSKVFSFTPDEYRVIQADIIEKGGSGYGDYNKDLPFEIEHICPDYTIYPMYKHAYGFTTRGCINKCAFCIVPKKEGIIKEHAEIEEFLGDRKSVVLMDNNIIACNHGLKQLEKSIDLKLKIDINQGIDARIINKNKDISNLLGRCKYINGIHLAYDNTAITDDVVGAINSLNESGIKPYRLTFYVLTKSGQIEDAYNRVMLLRSLGVNPFVMPYRDLNTKDEPKHDQKQFARWVNHKAIFKSCTFNEYKKTNK